MVYVGMGMIMRVLAAMVAFQSACFWFEPASGDMPAQPSPTTLALVSPPNADKVDCATAAERYQAAVSKVIEALHTYETCVQASEKRDDCAHEIQEIDTAHDDFADAVSDSKDCQ